jgi:outer membrane protein assembly factor BamA
LASGNPASAFNTSSLGRYVDGEASLPVRQELQNGKTLTSAIGYTLNYNTLDNNKNPTEVCWSISKTPAGVGGDVSHLKTAIDAKYYQTLVRRRRVDHPGRHAEPGQEQQPPDAGSFPDGVPISSAASP